MSPFEAYKLYLALKSHFTSSYDFFKYQGKMRVTLSSFEKRNDKHFFTKLAKHPDPQGLLVSSFIINPTIWIGDMLSDNVHANYFRWKSKQEGLTYHIMNDVVDLEPLEEAIRVKSGQHPYLLIRVLSSETKIETLIALNDVIKFVPSWNKRINDPIVWPALRFKCKKYKPFIKYELERVRKIVVEAVA